MDNGQWTADVHNPQWGHAVVQSGGDLHITADMDRGVTVVILSGRPDAAMKAAIQLLYYIFRSSASQSRAAEAISQDTREYPTPWAASPPSLSPSP